MATRKETRVVELRVDARQFNKQLKQANQNLEGIRKTSERTSNALTMMVRGFVAFQGARALRALAQASIEVERLDNVLRGASESQQEFASNLDFVREIADRWGVSMRTLQEGFAQFLAAGRGAGLEMDAIRTSFEQLTIAATAFQVSGTELQLMLVGARQLMGSAVVNMEDLRQVTERIPGAMQAAVEAVREMTGDLDMNAQAMRKLVAEGKVATDEFFPLFTQQLEDLGLKGAEQQSDSLRAELNRLNTAFDELARTIGSAVNPVIADFIGYVGRAAAGLNAWLGGATIQEAQDHARGVAALGREYSDAFDDVTKAQEALTSLQQGGVGVTGGDQGAYAALIEQHTAKLEAAQGGLVAVQESISFEQQMKGAAPTLPSANDQAIAREQAEIDKMFADMPYAKAPKTRAASGGGGGGGGRGGGAAAQAKDYADQIKRLRGELSPLVKLQQDFVEDMTLLNNAMAAGNITLEQKNELTTQLAMRQAEALEKLNQTSEELPQLAQDFGNAFADAFGQIITSASSLNDVLASLERQLISIITQALVLQPIKALLTGGTPFGPVMDLLGSILGRADGGPMQAGRPYLVGERGPEIVVPRMSGTVVPNEAVGGQTIVVNFNGNVTGEGLRQTASQIAAQIANSTSRAASRNG